MKKKLIIAFFLCLVINRVSSQTTFNVTVKDTVYDHQVCDAVELPSGNIIHVDSKGIPPSDVCSRVLKINTEGTVILQKDVRYADLPSVLGSITLNAENNLILSGVVPDPGSYKLWICTMDTDLNVISDKIYSLRGYNLAVSKITITTNKDIICFGTVKDTSFNTPFAFIYRLSPDLDSIQLKVFNAHWAWGMDLLERNDNFGFYFVVFGYSTGMQDPGKIISLDNLFNIRQVIVMPNIFNFSTIKYTDAKHLLVPGEYNYRYPSTDKRDIGVLCYDTLFNVMHSKEFGKRDTEDFPGLLKNISFTGIHSIFIGGTSNMGYSEFTQQDSWYMLNNADSSLELNWQKYYGGDGFYNLYGVIATKDSGCFMYGTVWDYHHTQNYTRYLSLIKVTNEGMLLSVNKDPSLQAHEAILYPNPGNNQLFVRTELKNSEILFNTIDGMDVCREKLLPGINSLDVKSLKPGMYIYKIIQNSQAKEYGKWIKE